MFHVLGAVEEIADSWSKQSRYDTHIFMIIWT